MVPLEYGLEGSLSVFAGYLSDIKDICGHQERWGCAEPGRAQAARAAGC